MTSTIEAPAPATRGVASAPYGVVFSDPNATKAEAVRDLDASRTLLFSNAN